MAVTPHPDPIVAESGPGPEGKGQGGGGLPGLKKAVFIVILLVFLAFSGIVYYFATHPKAVASLIETSLSRFAGISFRVKHLSYSLSPLRIEAKTLSLMPAGPSTGFSLSIPRFHADLSLDGPFGKRSLVLKKIHLSGFSLDYNAEAFAQIPKTPSSPSAVRSIATHLISLLLFRNIRIGEVELKDGTIFARLNGSVFTADRINAVRSAHETIDIDAAARLQWPAKAATLIIPSFHLSSRNALSLSDLTVNVMASANTMRLETPETVLKDMNLTIQGDLDLKKLDLNAPMFTLAIGDLLEAGGSARIAGGAQPALNISLQSGWIFPGKALGAVPEQIRKNFPPVSVTGKVLAEGSVAFRSVQDRWICDYDLNFGFSQNRFAYRAGDRHAHGGVSGTVRATGSQADFEISARLKVDDAEFAESRISVTIPEADVSLAGTHPDYRLSNLSARVLRVDGIKGMPIADIRLRMTEGTFGVRNLFVKLPEIQIESDPIKNIFAGIEADADTVRIRIDGKSTGLLSSAQAMGLVPEGWRLGGTDFLAIEATLRQGGPLSLNSRFRLEKLNFQDPAGRWVGENILAEIRFDGSVGVTDLSINGEMSATVTGGEALYDLFYFNLNKDPISAAAQGAYVPATHRIELEHLDLSMKNAFSLSITGGLDLAQPYGGRLKLHIPPTPLSPLFELLVKEPFQREYPYVADLKIDGKGATEMEIIGSTAAWAMKGHILWQDGSLSYREKTLEIAGIDMDLPLWHQTQDSTNPVRPMAGRLSIDSLGIPLLQNQPLRLHIGATPNRLSVSSPSTLQISGGRILLGPVRISDPFSSRRSIETDLQVNPTDISSFLSPFWPQLPQTQLQGVLDPVHIRGNRLETGGKLEIDAFDGKVVLSDLFVEPLFSDAPLVGLSAEFDGITLGRLTTGTAFGRIDGVLKGYVRNLQVAYGQPQRFELLLETVDKPDVPRKISITAVDNIARIGGGQSPFMGFAGVFSSLFETLNYEKIGIRASLGNDVFKINGTVYQDGKEYLMKGSLVSGVNIINQNPDNRIRFKDMLKRVQRVTSESGKPVIR